MLCTCNYEYVHLYRHCRYACEISTVDLKTYLSMTSVSRVELPVFKVNTMKATDDKGKIITSFPVVPVTNSENEQSTATI